MRLAFVHEGLDEGLVLLSGIIYAYRFGKSKARMSYKGVLLEISGRLAAPESRRKINGVLVHTLTRRRLNCPSSQKSDLSPQRLLFDRPSDCAAAAGGDEMQGSS